MAAVTTEAAKKAVNEPTQAADTTTTKNYNNNNFTDTFVLVFVERFAGCFALEILIVGWPKLILIFTMHYANRECDRRNSGCEWEWKWEREREQALVRAHIHTYI